VLSDFLLSKVEARSRRSRSGSGNSYDVVADDAGHGSRRQGVDDDKNAPVVAGTMWKSSGTAVR
jgi:hypothetical protein